MEVATKATLTENNSMVRIFITYIAIINYSWTEVYRNVCEVFSKILYIRAFKALWLTN